MPRSPLSGRQKGTLNRNVRGGRYFSSGRHAKGTISSSTFSARALEHSVSDGVLELRGSAALTPRFVGLIAATLNGAKVWR